MHCRMAPGSAPRRCGARRSCARGARTCSPATCAATSTRGWKLDAGGFEAIVLACAGLQRLGFEQRIRARLDAPDWLPAPAQGAIAIECRADDPGTQALCTALDHADTRVCVSAERAMNRALHGSCHVPVGAYARLDGARLRLAGLVGDAGDGRLVRAQAEGDAADPEALGAQVAQLLLDRGAAALLPPPQSGT
jgi:hydroxymethylbilane synthase